MMHRIIRAAFLITLMSGAAFAPITALAQAITPQIQTITPVPVAPDAAPVVAPKVTTTEAERKGRMNSDVFLGVYLSLDKECKVGAQPRLEVMTQPVGGKIRTRNYPINLRDVPGAPRRTCIGTSPNGLAIMYRSEKKFKGDDLARFKLIYPNGDIRDVSVKVVIQ